MQGLQRALLQRRDRQRSVSSVANFMRMGVVSKAAGGQRRNWYSCESSPDGSVAVGCSAPVLVCARRAGSAPAPAH